MVRIVATAISAIFCLLVLSIAADVIIDWAWFSDLGYLSVFQMALATKAAVFLGVFSMSIAALWANEWLAFRLGMRAQSGALVLGSDVARLRISSGADPGPPYLRLILAAAVSFASLLVALYQASQWDLFLRFLYQVPYGDADPVFGADLGFFLFSLPAYVTLKDWALTLIILSAATALAVYAALGSVQLGPRTVVSRAAIAHGSALLGALLTVKAGSYALDRYLLLYSNNDILVGAGYTDVNVTLPLISVLIALALIGAMLSFANVRICSRRLPVAAVVLVFGGSLVLGEVVPTVFQSLVVKPNELDLERPYIQRSINLTRAAYGLQNVAVRPFVAEQGLTPMLLEANQPTIDNIRLWDGGPLIDTYRQLQEIRTYYRFHTADVDRYWLSGIYRQVTLAAREIDTSRLPTSAQTWVNRHILFTHGSGVVMSPVNRKSSEGLPLFYLRDIPPAANSGPPISEPRIYFGEVNSPYVIVNSSVPEFDYPKGNANVFARYGGARGIPIGSTVWRMLFAWYFKDPSVVLTDYITQESRLLFRRAVKERVHTIAPFLRLDGNPYPVITDGRIVWIQDAYTTSNYFPYAQTVSRGEFDYIRNAAKVVIDGYDGSIKFYLATPSDPIARTYGRIFPELFTPLSRMPADLQRHLRYPQDLFIAQVQVYRTYHMGTPEVFYNREDVWELPRQLDGNGGAMAPYYMIIRLPGEAEAEFILMAPMVPIRRDNMIAWIAARCDPAHYGELIVYEFPKDKLVFGPFQIEARINQNTAISQQITLWNQRGSRVIRGNVHVIPIENSLLYVSPLYLRAEEGQIPELKRVIAAYGEQVVMEETLADALAVLFRQRAGAPSPEATAAQLAGGGIRELLRGHYVRAVEHLKRGDWANFGKEFDAMRALLDHADKQ